MPAGHLLQNDRMSVRLHTHGGALTEAVTRRGRPFLRGASGPVKDARDSACFPLVPLGNRVRGNSLRVDGRTLPFTPNADDPLYLHGDGWLADWEILAADGTSAVLAFDHPEPAASPHIYRATERVTLDGPHLRLDLSVENRGPSAMPFGLGFHPFFPRPGASVKFRAAAWWSEGDCHLPAAREDIPEEADFSRPRPLPGIWLNNAYEGWQGHATIRWQEAGLSVSLDADPLFSTLMVYAPDDDPSFFCLEPMSHLPGTSLVSGQDGLRLLGPGESLSGAIIFTVREHSE